ncbi:MAG: hypothetical protein AABZ02_04190 [Bacteroidota bacterium]
MEQTRIGMWHLHVDVTRCGESLAAWFIANEFAHAHFLGHPPGYEHYEPSGHFTAKFDTEEAFRALYDHTCAQAASGDFVGYVEGEYISRVIEIPDRPLVAIPDTPPFVIHRRRLRQDEQFRQGEFHLSFDADASDPVRIEQLLKAGLYGSYVDKHDGLRYLVLTMQGYMRDIIRLTEKLESFLNEGGGLVRARLKVERAIAWQLFNVTTTDLPPIADHIEW